MHIQICTYMYESYIYICRVLHLYLGSNWNLTSRFRLLMHKGWQKLIGCLMLQVIFRKRATNSRALLWKMTNKDKASYGSTTPCTHYVLGWIRLVGPLKLQVFFAEYRLFYRALFFQQRPVIFKEPTNRSHPILIKYSTFSGALTFERHI